MKYLFYLLLVIMVLIGGFWVAKNQMEKPQKGQITKSALPTLNDLGRGQPATGPSKIMQKDKKPRGDSLQVPPNFPGLLREEIIKDSGGPEPNWEQRQREEIAEAMRQAGMAEEEIQKALEGYEERIRAPEQALSPYESTLEELSPEQLEAEIRANLKEAKIPPEDIEEMGRNLKQQLLQRMGKSAGPAPSPTSPQSPR